MDDCRVLVVCRGNFGMNDGMDVFVELNGFEEEFET